MFKKYICIGQIFLAMILALAMPNIANAADLFDIPSGDLSKQLFIDVLFPSDLAASPIAKVMLVFNSVALLLGGILAAYTLIAGTMQTAHDGEMLGKKWSSMWIPIRTAIGTAMLLPAAGGFCAAQVLVLWMINQGVGFADKLWTAYTENDDKTVAYVATPNAAGIYKLANQLLANNYCVLVMNAQDESFNSEDKYPSNNDSLKYSRYVDSKFTVTGQKSVYNYGKTVSDSGFWNSVGSFFSGSASEAELSNACGTLSILTPTAANSSLDITSANMDKQAYSIGKVFGNDFSSFDATGVSNINTLAGTFGTVFNVQKEQALALDDKMKTLATSIYNNDTVDPSKQMQAATVAYQNAIKTSVAKLFSTTDTWANFKAAMDTQGWLMAGSWYINVSKYQNLISTVVNIVPESTGFTVNDKYFNNEKYLGKMNNFIGKMKVVNRSSPYVGLDIGNQLLEDSGHQVDRGIDTDGNGKYVAQMQNQFKLINTGIAAFLSSMNEDTASTDPLSVAIGLGNTLNSIVSWVMFGSIAVSFFIPAIGSAITAILVPMMFFSIVLTVIIPFTPYIMWMAVVAGWMILCLEAMIGAPLWIVTHLHPDGDGPVGGGRSGYGMILSLTLRPSLMIFGLICAMLILPILVNLVNISFGTTFAAVAASSDGGLGVFQAMGIIFVYTLLLLTMVKKSFSLIHIIPDEIMKWLGVNANGSMQSHSNEMVGAVAGAQALQQMNAITERGAGAIGQIRPALKERERNQGEAGEQAFGSDLGSIGGGSIEQDASNEENAESASGVSNVHAESLMQAGHTDISAKDNEKKLNDFQKRFPDPGQAPKEELNEMQNRASLYDQQLQTMSSEGSGFSRAKSATYNNKLKTAKSNNGLLMTNINKALNRGQNNSNNE